MEDEEYRSSDEEGTHEGGGPWDAMFGEDSPLSYSHSGDHMHLGEHGEEEEEEEEEAPGLPSLHGDTFSLEEALGAAGHSQDALQELLARLGSRGHALERSGFLSGLLGAGGGGRYRQLLDRLRAHGNDPEQEAALSELTQMLLMGNEETLQGFRPDQFVPVLVRSAFSSHTIRTTLTQSHNTLTHNTHTHTHTRTA
jgi:hypothetical protein